MMLDASTNINDIFTKVLRGVVDMVAGGRLIAKKKAMSLAFNFIKTC